MILLHAPATCSRCGFSTPDVHLLSSHSCNTQENGGTCEDFPCCGHEYGDCNGLKYGSDESIKAYVASHFLCDHEAGHFACEDAHYECDDEDCAVTGTCTC